MDKAQIKIIDKGASTEIKRQGYELNAHSITKWLISRCIIEQNEQLLDYTDLLPWLRGGGETYYTYFQVKTNRRVSQIVIKALVSMFPEKSLRDWTRRRSILAESGIPVSKWYWFGEAIIVEDFYEFTAKEKVDLKDLLCIAFKLDSLGFASLKFIDDVRADSDGNPYFIDFGFDLGEPSGIKTTYAKNCLYQAFPNNILEIDKFYANSE